MKKNEIAGMIDHTLLAAFAKRSQIEKLCEEAVQYGFASVCVNPVHVKFAGEKLAGSEVAVCTVIGFPLGSTTTKVTALLIIQKAKIFSFIIPLLSRMDTKLYLKVK